LLLEKNSEQFVAITSSFQQPFVLNDWFSRHRIFTWHLLLIMLNSWYVLNFLVLYYKGILRWTRHIHYILSQCAQRMYLLKLLKHQCMSVEKLSVAAHSLIVSWILYALPAWGGFLSAELSGRLDVLLRWLKRLGYIQNIFRYQDLLDKADEDLFSNMCSSQHCLHHLLPPLRSVDNLRERGHSFILPDYNTKTDKKSFVLRSLSNYLI